MVLIGKSAYANARLYFDSVRVATQKEQKTIEASKKAFQNAERATQHSLKQIDFSARSVSPLHFSWKRLFINKLLSSSYIVDCVEFSNYTVEYSAWLGRPQSDLQLHFQESHFINTRIHFSFVKSRCQKSQIKNCVLTCLISTPRS